MESQPIHSVENALNHFFRGALNVGIFYAQDEDAAVFAREEPVEQGGARATQVKIASRRWGEANSHDLAQGLFDIGDSLSGDGETGHPLGEIACDFVRENELVKAFAHLLE